MEGEIRPGGRLCYLQPELAVHQLFSVCDKIFEKSHKIFTTIVIPTNLQIYLLNSYNFLGGQNLVPPRSTYVFSGQIWSQCSLRQLLNVSLHAQNNVAGTSSLPLLYSQFLDSSIAVQCISILYRYCYNYGCIDQFVVKS